jgi:membrane protein implicated in regulation of membrane protease activity
VISELFGGVHPAVLWGILAIVLAVTEMALPGVFLIWLSLAAALTAGFAFLLPLGEPFQLLAFAIFSALSVSGGRLWYLARPVESEDAMLNDRAARMIGRQVVVIEAISHGEGRVSIDDGSWTATGPDAPIGTHMLVTGVSGSILTVAYPPVLAG